MARTQAIDHIGIGVDIEDIARFVKLGRRKDRRFLERIFTARELAYCFAKKNPAPHLAVRFCAKEAVIKALASVGLHAPIPHHAVEIVRSDNGVPHVRVRRGIRCTIHVSLSHSKDYAIAFAAVEKI